MRRQKQRNGYESLDQEDPSETDRLIRANQTSYGGARTRRSPSIGYDSASEGNFEIITFEMG